MFLVALQNADAGLMKSSNVSTSRKLITEATPAATSSAEAQRNENEQNDTFGITGPNAGSDTSTHHESSGMPTPRRLAPGAH